MSNELGEGLKKLVLAGIGAAAVTAEKAQEILGELVKKGELTVEQGKVLNEELKHSVRAAAEKTKTGAAEKADGLIDRVDELTGEQLEKLRKKLDALEKPASGEAK